MAMKFYSDIECQTALHIEDTNNLQKITLSKCLPLSGGFDLGSFLASRGETSLDNEVLNQLVQTGRYYVNSTDYNITLELQSDVFQSQSFIKNLFVGDIIVEDAIGDSEFDSDYIFKRQRIRIYEPEGDLITIGNIQLDSCHVEFVRHFYRVPNETGEPTPYFGSWQVNISPHLSGGNIKLPQLYLDSFDEGKTEIGEVLKKLGFKQGNITTTSGQFCGDIAKLGKIVYGAIYNPNVSVPIRLSFITGNLYNINLQIPNDFHSSEASTIYTSKIPLIQYTGANNAGNSYIFGDCTISNNTIIIQNLGQLFAPALANNIKHYFWYVLDDDFEPVPTV